ncbi:hypothetical protein MLD38_004502 [Melastoma candidum]|uniref:Uncharacterized protein n=1 Tax=Melastoma candidum TaxID=119954 RepID=A0ACB9S540_9MYRT|nr:hypothetical protein MLD38_004502 [Melastoma candidum]
MKVDVVSRECVKPLSPTPSHLKRFGLSLLDQLQPQWLYGTIVLFYAPTPSRSVDEKLGILQKSLSEALVLFYPFAGRVVDAITIECNDEGAFLVTGYADVFLHDGFLRSPDADSLNMLIPMIDPTTADLARTCLLIVQATVFRCGGMAIAICTSHKLVDGSSACAFVKTWSALALASANCDLIGQSDKIIPQFLGGSLIPPKIDMPTNFMVRTTINPRGEKCITKRFVFDGSRIASLKEKFLPRIVSKVEVVQALILKSAILVVSRSEPEYPQRPRTSVVSQTINLRKRMEPPLGEDTIGNHFWMDTVCLGEGGFELAELVEKIREGNQRFYKETAGQIKGEEAFSVIRGLLREREETLRRNEEVGRAVDVYRFTSLSKFPFYGIDFGWGRAEWVTSPSNFEKLFVLVDARGGEGVEAWMTLKEREMAMLEKEEEFLAYAKLNPDLTSGRHSRM